MARLTKTSGRHDSTYSEWLREESTQRKSRPDDSNEQGTSVLQANSIKEIRAALNSLAKQEATVTLRLNALVASQREVSRNLGKLDLLRANIGSQAVATRSVSNGMLSNAAATARRVSGAVRKLDLEQARVKETLNVVEQVVDLKACVLGVTGSMGAAQDWETAAGYIHRASQISPKIVGGAFAEEIVPTAEVPDPPGVTLAHAAESLRGLFLREFEQAARESNGTKVTRFFKLFPLIGKPDVGLDVYGRYVCQGVASRARASLNAGTTGSQRKEGFFYATALTKLFEHVAQIVEHHGALVERHYGAGRMIKIIERLQLEADVQGGIIVDTWCDEKSIDRRLTDVKSYPFTFLVQSFLQAPPARSGTPRAGSPATRAATAETPSSEEGDLNMRDIDKSLGEAVLMLGRWSLYSRFIASKSKEYLQVTGEDSHALRIPPFLLNSSLNRKICDQLITPFNIMTTFFVRRSIETAFQLDEQPSGLSLNPTKGIESNPPYITSAVDDIMYMVDQIVDRSLATSQRAVISNVIPSIARVLESDFIGMIQRKMRDESYPKAAVQGTLPPEHVILAFFVLVNDLDVAIEYVKRIVQSRIEKSSVSGSQSDMASSKPNTIATLFPFEHDAVFVSKTLQSLQNSFEAKTSELINDGIFVVFKNVVKPRLRPVLTDTFRDLNYQMTPEELEAIAREQELEDTDINMIDRAVQRHFERGWDALTKPIARILTEQNFERLLATIISYLGEVLEKRIWSYYGRLNGIGGVRLERDVTSIVNVIISGGRYSLRDVFARCTQICLVMNMEEDEWEELQALGSEPAGAGDNEWRINAEERSRARGMVRTSN